MRSIAVKSARRSGIPTVFSMPLAIPTATALAALYRLFTSAEGGIRTPTGICPLRPERSASTSSTTSAGTYCTAGV